MTPRHAMNTPLDDHLANIYYDGVGSINRARHAAEQALSRDHPQRWAHTQNVAATAGRLAKQLPLQPWERTQLVAAAYYHDIGYAISEPMAGWHPLDGAYMLRQENLDGLVGLIAWHATAKEESKLLGMRRALEMFATEPPVGLVADALTYADMTTGPHGDPCTFEERRNEITERYGPTATPAKAMKNAWPRLLKLRARIDHAISTHTPVIHDRYCPQSECALCAYTGPGCCRGDCQCVLIELVRSDERHKTQTERDAARELTRDAQEMGLIP